MILNEKITTLIKNKLTYISLIIIGLIVKCFFLNVKIGDYIYFLEPWINFIKAHGFGSSLKYNFYNYTPSYIYLLILIAKLGLNPLYSIKIVSIVFEFITAYFIGKIAYLKYKSDLLIWVCLGIIPILPSVMLNSSYLSQCDSIYTSFIVGSIYFILKKKQFLSVLFLGVAFALKMQTAIILPFYFVIMLKGNMRWWYFAMIPLVYIISTLPAWLYGRPFLDLMSIYGSQSKQYHLLTLNFPNFYIWINNGYYEMIMPLGIFFTVILTLFIGHLLGKRTEPFTLESWSKLAFISAIIIPFILPGMHERYMYVGDVLGVLYYLIYRKNIHLPICILIVSVYSYIRCSRFNEILPMYPAFFIYVYVIIFTSIDFIRSFKMTQNEISQ